MDKQLAIAALGNDRPGLVKAISQLVVDLGCNINDSRMSILGGKFALILLVDGSSEAIDNLANEGPKLAAELGLTLTAEVTSTTTGEQALSPYSVRAVAIDNPGIVYRLSHFFSQREINIRNLHTERYAAAHTGTALFAVSLQIDVPTTLKLGELRQQLLAFADELNIDISIDAVTPPLT